MSEIRLAIKKRDEAGGASPCCAGGPKETPRWAAGTIMTPAGAVFRVSCDWSKRDYWEHIKCRTGSYRNDYRISPGLYAVGEPDKTSPVAATANYKYSFDMLRRGLKDVSAWVLVLDTKGINVWCAAGKGTFGTEELVTRIAASRLGDVVGHREIILPQLGAPGVSGYKVTKATGFKVRYGPVSARDIRAYLDAGCKATAEMRTVQFPLIDRLVLTPMELNPAMKKYPLYALAALAVFGLRPAGIFFRDALTGGLPFLLLGLVSVFSGSFLTPVLLPFLPFRSFALKGWVAGMASVFLFIRASGLFGHAGITLLLFTFLFFPMASSYIALQFTGSTTFTGMSGVKKELRVGVPLYLASAGISSVLLVLFKLQQWGVL